jgi:2-iminobutanoate/2-iminopropanoate deaminase
MVNPPLSIVKSGSGYRASLSSPVFISDARYGDRFTQLRKEMFGDNFPASALITVAGLARPEMLVEVSGDRGTWLKSKTARP